MKQKQQKTAIKIAYNPTRVLELAADLLPAVANRSLKAIAATVPSVTRFISQGKKFVFWRITAIIRQSKIYENCS